MALAADATNAALALVAQLDALTSLIETSDRSRWSGAVLTMRETLNREANAAAQKARLAPPTPLPVIPVTRGSRIGY